jgi:CheY-like chemotaxis protein
MEKREVLVIEDNAADRVWLEHVLKLVAEEYNNSSVTDGQQAVDFLLKRGQYRDAPTPDVIFLDVHLPILDGIEVLRQIPNARALPLCVLTSSESEREAFRQEFGVEDSNYVLKPASQESVLSSSCWHQFPKTRGRHERN